MFPKMNNMFTVNSAMAETEKPVSPGIPAKMFAGFFSYIFHPVFVPLYVTAFLLYVHPAAFSGFSVGEKRNVMFIIGLNIVAFPLLSVLLTRAVGFIDSIFLRTQKDRIIPYILSGIFFFWAYLVFKNQPQYPLLLTTYILGIFLASSVALIANIYFKISMHAIGMGSWLGFFLVIFRSNTMLMTWPLCIVILITGLVCTSRLITRSHDQKDIYMGLLVGAVTQFAAAVVVMS